MSRRKRVGLMMMKRPLWGIGRGFVAVVLRAEIDGGGGEGRVDALVRFVRKAELTM